MTDNNNKSSIERLKEFFENASPLKKLALLAIPVALLVGIVFLILGNSTYFFYSSVCIVGLYILLRIIP